MARCNAKICKHWLTLKLTIIFRAHKCAMMTERADAFSGPRLCLHTELFEFCGSFSDLAHESCIKGANHVRGGV